MYALGIINVGNDTREVTTGSNIALPNTNETMLFQKLQNELFTDYIGLFQFLVPPGEHPGEVFAREIREFLGIKLERKQRSKCMVSEIVRYVDRVYHNMYHVFAQRLAHVPAMENEEEIMQIRQTKVYDMRGSFHPTHYEILRQFILTARRATDKKPQMLEIELEQTESGAEGTIRKCLKPMRISWS